MRKIILTLSRSFLLSPASFASRGIQRHHLHPASIIDIALLSLCSVQFNNFNTAGKIVNETIYGDFLKWINPVPMHTFTDSTEQHLPQAGILFQV